MLKSGGRSRTDWNVSDDAFTPKAGAWQVKGSGLIMERFLFVLAFALLAGGHGSGEAQASPAGISRTELQPVFTIRATLGNHRPPVSTHQAPLVIQTTSKSDEFRGEDYFIARNTEAAQLHSKGRVLEAEGILRSVLKESIAIRGEDDKYTVLTMLNLAEICIFQGQHREAINLLQAVVSVYKKQIGPDHHKTADLIARLASVHLSRGDIAEAEPLFEEVLRIRRKSLGAMHPNSLLALDALGGIHYSLGRFSEARRLYTEALEGFEKAMGPMHEQTQRTRRNLTQVPTHLEWPEQPYPAIELRQF